MAEKELLAKVNLSAHSRPAPFVCLISHQPAVLFSQNKSATSNQPAVLFSQIKSASAINHQPTEQTSVCSSRMPDSITIYTVLMSLTKP
jgi:hypothetical protein